MRAATVDIASFETRHQVDFPRYFARSLDRLQSLEADGLVICTRKRITVTARGQFLLRNIAMCFDAYIDATEVRYSRTV